MTDADHLRAGSLRKDTFMVETPRPPQAGAPTPPPATSATSAAPVASAAPAAPPALPPAPPPPAVVQRPTTWRIPKEPPRGAVLACLGALAVIAATTLLAPAGAHWLVLALLVAAVAWLSGHGRPSPSGLLLGGLAVALVGVAAIRSSSESLALCLPAALGLAAAAALQGRRWPAIVLAVPALAPAGVLGALWVAKAGRAARMPRNAFAWARGAVIGVLLTTAVIALLASADEAFAGLIDSLTPAWDLDLAPRLLLAALVTLLAIALMYAHRVRPHLIGADGWERRGPLGEWTLPLVLLNVVLISFLLVQAVVLFEAYPESLVSGDLTPAERARQGFGQLVVVTLLIAVTLGWAALRSNPRLSGHRRLLLILGGGLVLEALVVVASALRRMWLYEQAFGWTVLRLDVAAFEVWLAVILALAAGAWLIGRAAVVPRLVIGSAGAALLVLSLASPDALVARWNVDRFERTGAIDLIYATRLSDDALPQLARLPEPQRSCVLNRAVTEAPWYAANWSRIRAERVVATAHLGGC